MMKEVLTSRGFSESEINTLKSLEDYEVMRLRVERLQADSLLDKLEARTGEKVETQRETLETRWENFKASISKLESSDKWTGKKDATEEILKDIQTRLKTEATKKTETAIHERLSGIPFFGESIANWLIKSGKEYISNNDDSVGGKMKNLFFTMIAGMFGVKGILNTLKNDSVIVPDTALIIEDHQEIPTNTTVEGTGKDHQEIPTNTTVERIGEDFNIINFRYNTGIGMLISFSNGQSLENDSHIKNTIFNDIKKLTLHQVNELSGNPDRQLEVFGDNLNNPGFSEGLNILLPSFENTGFLEVCELSLSGNRIEEILSPHGIENLSLFKILGPQRSREIVRLSKIPGFELASLTMHELSILYFASFPNIAYGQLASGKELGMNAHDTTSSEIQEMINSSASGKILTFLAKNGDGGITSLLIDDQRFLTEVSGAYPKMDIKEIKDIIKFKDYVLNGKFQTNTSLKLSGETLNVFKGNLNYARIILLYDILKGGSVEEVNPLNFPLLIIAISSIIAGKAGDNLNNTKLAEKYKGEFIRNGVAGFFGKDTITESEKRAFEIYGENFVGLGIHAALQSIYGKIGILEGITGFSDGAMLTGSSIAAFGGRQLLQSAYPSGGGILLGRATAGRYLMRAGWAGLIIYGGMLGYEYFYGDEEGGGNTAPNIPIKNDGIYIGHRIDKDLKGAPSAGEKMQILSQLRENTHEYTIGDESITIITYPGDIPHAVYQKKLWVFQVLDSNNLPGNIESTILNSIKGLGKDNEVDINTVGTDGKTINVGTDGDNTFKYTLNDLFVENRAPMGIETVRDLQWALKATVDEILPGDNFPEGQDLGQYISIMPLPGEENKFLGLVAAPKMQAPTS